MDFGTFLWTTFAAFVTLATFSFLYKDNPFYKIAEHLVVGVSAGYFVIILWHNGLVPNLFQRLADGDWYVLWLNSSRPWYLIPTVLGMLMWTRFSKKWSWVSRWPMGLYIGISTGIAIPLEMSNRVSKQLYATMVMNPNSPGFDWAHFFGHGGFNLLDISSGLSQLIIFVGALAALVYFFFSKAHTGLFGGLATFGIWILMIGFGASFGFTVMARVSLFINRVQFLDQNWIQNAFNSANPNYNAWYQVVFWLMMLLLLWYIIRELVNYGKGKGTGEAAA
ncbi:MAG TPA: hypothetical protein VMY05_08480 [Acidobacteriota bacterium]|nr:hypothetical protein [Acidobacteriota bacterium]